MARFTYIGGKDFDETELPAAVTLFGVRFIEGVPKDVDLRDFRNTNEHEHALRKLRAHKNFKEELAGQVEVITDPVEPAPAKRTWSRRKKVEEPVAETVEVIE